jgi:hypothetical protein
MNANHEAWKAREASAAAASAVTVERIAGNWSVWRDDELVANFGERREHAEFLAMLLEAPA